MKNRSCQLFHLAILTVLTIAPHAATAQSRGSEFPPPQQGTQTDNRSATAADKTGAAAPMPSGGSLGAARALPFDQMTPKINASGGESRDIAHGTLATGETVNLHQSMQVVGQAPPALHVIQHSEFILVREGEIEFDHEVDGKIVAEKVGPGGAFYVAYGTRHAIKNVGSVPARYFVVAIGGDAK
jgi:mannose-6-phosphate isomerase-like protein (cupin superfamily)